ncbi:MAG TPA: hypothetical protein VFM02_04145 [Candidatus Paceibacterota bacterium]|nr:hypothetical protein [Candidatus Paceibacterota bacterium]
MFGFLKKKKTQSPSLATTSAEKIEGGASSEKTAAEKTAADFRNTKDLSLRAADRLYAAPLKKTRKIEEDLGPAAMAFTPEVSKPKISGVPKDIPNEPAPIVAAAQPIQKEGEEEILTTSKSDLQNIDPLPSEFAESDISAVQEPRANQTTSQIPPVSEEQNVKNTGTLPAQEKENKPIEMKGVDQEISEPAPFIIMPKADAGDASVPFGFGDKGNEPTEKISKPLNAENEKLGETASPEIPEQALPTPRRQAMETEKALSPTPSPTAPPAVKSEVSDISPTEKSKKSPSETNPLKQSEEKKEEEASIGVPKYISISDIPEEMRYQPIEKKVPAPTSAESASAASEEPVKVDQEMEVRRKRFPFPGELKKVVSSAPGQTPTMKPGDIQASTSSSANVLKPDFSSSQDSDTNDLNMKPAQAAADPATTESTKPEVQSAPAVRKQTFDSPYLQNLKKPFSGSMSAPVSSSALSTSTNTAPTTSPRPIQMKTTANPANFEVSPTLSSASNLVQGIRSGAANVNSLGAMPGTTLRANTAQPGMAGRIPVGTGVQNAASKISGKSKEETPAPITPKQSWFRTYRDDFKRGVKDKGPAVISGILAEEDEKRRLAKAASGAAPKNLFFVILSAILFLGSLGIILFVFLLHHQQQPVALSTPHLILAEENKTIPLKENPSTKELYQLLTAAEHASIPQNTVENLSFVQTISTGSGNNAKALQKIAIPKDIFSALASDGSTQLLNTLTDQYMFGIYASASGNHPFMILKTNAYENAFSGMMSWEKTLPQEFYLWFGLSATSTPGNTLGSTAGLPSAPIAPLSNDYTVAPTSSPNSSTSALIISTSTEVKDSTSSSATGTMIGTTSMIPVAPGRMNTSTPPLVMNASDTPPAVQIPQSGTTTGTSTAGLPGLPWGVNPVHGTFQDTIIDNKDVRVLENPDHSVNMLYSFRDEHTIIITNDIGTLQEIFRRLDNAQ